MVRTPPLAKKNVPYVSAMDVIRTFVHAILRYKWIFLVDVSAVIIAAVANVWTPLYYKKFFDLIISASDRAVAAPQLTHTVLMILTIGSIVWLAYRINNFAHNYFQTHAMARLKQDAFDYMMLHSYSFFANNFTGSLTQRVNRFAKAFERLTDRFVWTLIPITIQVVGIVIVLWFQSPKVSLIVTGFVVAFLVTNFVISQWKLKYDVLRSEIDSRATGYLSDTVTNSSTIQLFSAHAFESHGYKSVTNEQGRANLTSWNFSTIVDSIQAGILILAEAALLYTAGQLWVEGVITVGTIVLIQVYFIGLGAKLWDFTRIIRDVYEGFAEAKEMLEIMKTPHEIKDLPTATRILVLKGKIEYRDLVFNFNETRTVLDKINLTINAGEKVAIIGPSGAGKSTFVRLLLRFYDPTSGSIIIDEQDIKYVTQDSLRANISLVPQDPILFHRTLKENIRYGRREASDEDVLEAAKLAHCDEFVKDLPLGYDTYVGERGIKLSGGERQRVAIARAILKNAPILILDEATSSLDSESESYIQDALDVLMKGKTTIVIAHRLSTIRKMDRIIVIDQGKVLEEGSHDDLLKNENSLYKKLWELQAGGFLKEEENVD